MKVIGVILAKNNIPQFPNKPFALINGKTILEWTYHHASYAKCFEELFVATEDDLVVDLCNTNKMNVIKIPNQDDLTAMLNEVAKVNRANYYVFIDCAEVLLDAVSIDSFVKEAIEIDPPVANAMTEVEGKELKNQENIKIIYNTQTELLAVTRDKPSHKAEHYYKYVGLGLYNNRVLDFFVNTPKGSMEKEQKCELVRFPEHNINVKMIKTSCKTIAANNPKELKIFNKIIN